MRSFSRLPALTLAAAALHASVLTAAAEPIVIRFETELVSMTLTGSAAIPLAQGDPSQNDGYEFVDSSVVLRLSSQRINPGPTSPGGACASTGFPPNPCVAQGDVDPGPLEGTQFHVDSFFDVFFDITITDMDPAKNFVGQADGASLSFLDSGPMRFTSSHVADFTSQALQSGLWPPPESAPFVGYDLVIPLGVDVNGNGENDVLKFTQLSLTLLDANRTFISLPDGTVFWSGDVSAALDGGVMDESSDPPFSIELTGPTTARSETTPVPEPGTLLLVAGGLALLGRRRGR